MANEATFQKAGSLSNINSCMLKVIHCRRLSGVSDLTIDRASANLRTACLCVVPESPQVAPWLLSQCSQSKVYNGNINATRNALTKWPHVFSSMCLVCSRQRSRICPFVKEAFPNFYASLAIIPEKYTYIVPHFLNVRKLALVSGRQRVISLCAFSQQCA